ncbi:MAG: MGMT family protein [Firmicutes bacterium]|nr:MGMT family protein [Bacillota bacterium]
MDSDLIYQILSVVEEIPPGLIATYGQIADLAGLTGRARLVGKVLSVSSFYGDYPCHRVVNHQGRTAPGFLQQRALLEEEGVTFLKNGRVDLKKHRWNGN